MIRPVAMACGAAIAALLAVSCERSPAPPGVAQGGARSLLVLAAASTREPMEELTREYGRLHGVEVRLGVGSSNELAMQVIAGSGADLFVSADERWCDAVEREGLAIRRQALLSNRLVLIAPADGTAQIDNPRSLVSPQMRRVALAGEDVPAGRYGRQALSALGLLDQLGAEEKLISAADVRSVLAFVDRGEVDAGIVYATDATVAGNVRIVHEFDSSTHDPIIYGAVLVKGDAAPEEANRLFDYLTGDAAAEVFHRYGFMPPP